MPDRNAGLIFGIIIFVTVSYFDLPKVYEASIRDAGTLSKPDLTELTIKGKLKITAPMMRMGNENRSWTSRQFFNTEPMYPFGLKSRTR
jgi:hypothetical protein